jgi:hypothetical protein
MVKAKKRSKNSARRKTSVMKRPYFMKKKSNHRRRSSKNPAFFGAKVTPVKMAEYLAAGLARLSNQQ